MARFRLPLLRVLLLALLGAVLIVFPFLHTWPGFDQVVTKFRTFNATMFAVWLLVVLSMNLLTGYSGQISLGHAAVVLFGAFTTAILSNQFDVPMPLAIALAGLFTALVGGLVIGIPAVRLSGPYLAIATFALVLSLPQILKLAGLKNWTHGALGIRVHELQPPGFVDRFLDQSEWLYYVTMATAVFMTVIFWNLTRSRIGSRANDDAWRRTSNIASGSRISSDDPGKDHPPADSCFTATCSVRIEPRGRSSWVVSSLQRPSAGAYTCPSCPTTLRIAVTFRASGPQFSTAGSLRTRMRQTMRRDGANGRGIIAANG